MTRTNLTIQIDDAVVRRARVVAAKRGTSISALVALELDRLVDADERYEVASRQALELLDRASSGQARTWARDELHAR